MKIDLYCPDVEHPTYVALEQWTSCHEHSAIVKLLSRKDELRGGDLLVLVSVPEIFTSEIASKYKSCLVIHGSDLPLGKGWSPIVWQILSGEEQFTLSLIEVSHPVDSGDIWYKASLHISKTALFDEIQELIASKTIELIAYAIENFNGISPKPQIGESTFYPRRSPADSELDPSRTLESLFDQLRVSDPNRYPAFFHLRGKTFRLTISEHS